MPSLAMKTEGLNDDFLMLMIRWLYWSCLFHVVNRSLKGICQNKTVR